LRTGGRVGDAGGVFKERTKTGGRIAVGGVAPERSVTIGRVVATGGVVRERKSERGEENTERRALLPYLVPDAAEFE
jgi:hypothetical protein